MKKKNNTIIYIGNQLQGKGLNPTTVDTLGNKLSNEFILIRASQYGNPILRIFHMWSKIILNCNKSKYLLIDTYSTGAFLYAWTSASLASMLGLYYIPYLHGGDLPLRYRRNPKICASFFRNAKRIVSPSEYLKAETEKLFSVKVEVIPNYLELDHYPFKQRERIKQINLLWVRAFHEIYNPVLAIMLIALLSKRGYENCRLTMVGPEKDGSMEKVKKMIDKFNLGDSITLTGQLKKEEWVGLSKSHNIFINTTNADNTPVSVMEAMALGFPVITTNVGGIPYLFENGKEGIQVPPNNVDAMVSAIIDLVEHPQKAEDLSKNARKKAETWDWDVVKEKWMDLLQK